MLFFLTRRLIKYLFINDTYKYKRRRVYTSKPQLNTVEAHYHSGYYTPKFPHKYNGDVTDIIYRSGWEHTAFIWCDYNPHIVSWSSEDVPISYYMKGVPYARIYYPDLIIRFREGEVVMIEIKPNAEKQSPNYENRCKWAAARAHCREEGWQFRIWDEITIDKLRETLSYWRKTHIPAQSGGGKSRC